MLAFNNVGVRGANPPQIQKSLYSFTVDPLYPCSMYLFEKKKLPISGLTQLTCVVQKLNQLSQQLNDLCFSENDFISFGIIIAYSSGFTPKV